MFIDSFYADGLTMFLGVLQEFRIGFFIPPRLGGHLKTLQVSVSSLTSFLFFTELFFPFHDIRIVEIFGNILCPLPKKTRFQKRV